MNYQLRSIPTFCAVFILALLSAFSSEAQAPSRYQTANQVVIADKGCVNVLFLGLVCGDIQNQAQAVDTSRATAATLTTPAALTSVRLRVKLPTAAQVGDRAGVLVSSEAGLDLTALSAITVSTYMGANNIARQEFALGTTLNVVAASTALTRAEFTVTAPFDRLELRAGGLLNASYTVRLHQVYSYGNDAPLPVELVSFKAKALPGAADLTWQTASERNSRVFVVERSTDGQRFERIGAVAAQGNSAYSTAYAFRDEKLTQSLSHSVTYYRLRQQDHDGKESFSPVAAVVVPAAAVSAELVLYPNPVAKAEVAAVQVSGLPAGGQQALLYNSQGRQVLRLPLATATAQVPVGALPAGLYVLAVVDAAGQRLGQQRLLVQ